MQLLTEEQEALSNILNAIHAQKNKGRFNALFKIQGYHTPLFTVGLYDKENTKWVFKESCIKNLSQAEKLLITTLKQLKLI